MALEYISGNTGQDKVKDSVRKTNEVIANTIVSASTSGGTLTLTKFDGSVFTANTSVDLSGYIPLSGTSSNSVYGNIKNNLNVAYYSNYDYGRDGFSETKSFSSSSSNFLSRFISYYNDEQLNAQTGILNILGDPYDAYVRADLGNYRMYEGTHVYNLKNNSNTALSNCISLTNTNGIEFYTENTSGVKMKQLPTTAETSTLIWKGYADTNYIPYGNINISDLQIGSLITGSTYAYTTYQEVGVKQDIVINNQGTTTLITDGVSHQINLPNQSYKFYSDNTNSYYSVGGFYFNIVKNIAATGNSATTYIDLSNETGSGAIEDGFGGTMEITIHASDPTYYKRLSAKYDVGVVNKGAGVIFYHKNKIYQADSEISPLNIVLDITQNISNPNIVSLKVINNEAVDYNFIVTSKYTNY